MTGILRSAAASAVAFLLITGAFGADPEAGRAKAQVCAACHGPEGDSVDPAVPSLAGQPALAISTQLFQFREGNRKDPHMSPLAVSLSNADMNDLAAYFASVTPAPTKHQTAPQNRTAGAELTRKFHCVQCHGQALRGQQHIPRVAGQQPDYIRAQLQKFKAGVRSDIDGNMTAAAEPLSASDIEILVDYIAGLAPR